MIHNGSRTQVHLDAIINGHPFINMAKCISSLAETGGTNTATFNEDNYLTNTPTNPINAPIKWPPLSTYSGNYVWRWRGQGSVGFDMGGAVSIVGGLPTGVTQTDDLSLGHMRLNSDTTSGVHRVVWTTSHESGGGLSLRFHSGVNISDIVLLREDHEDLYDQGEIFNPDFIDYVKWFGLIRFGDWCSMTTSSPCPYAQRPVESSLMYNWRPYPGVYGGSITGTTTKVMTAYPGMPVTYTDKEFFSGVNAIATGVGTGQVTLNVGGRGAKAVWNDYMGVVGVSSDTEGYEAGRYYTHYYDAKFDKIIRIGTGDAGMPLEVVAALCNKVRAHCWYNFQFNMTDATIVSTATKLRDLLDPALKLYAESGNEPWNPRTPMYWQLKKLGNTYYGITFQYPPNDSDEDKFTAHGYQYRTFAQAITPVFSGQEDRLVRISNVQMVAGYEFNYKPWTYQGQLMSPVPSYPNRPGDWADATCGGSYIDSSLIPQFGYLWGAVAGNVTATTSGTALWHAQQYALGTEPAMTNALEFVDATIRNVAGVGTYEASTLQEFINTNWPRWNAAAAEWGHVLLDYESALAISGPRAYDCTYTLGISTNYSPWMYNLLNAYRQGPYGRQFVKDRFDAFLAFSEAEWPSQYNLWAGDASGEDLNPWGIIPGPMYYFNAIGAGGGFDGIIDYNTPLTGTDYADPSLSCAVRYADFYENGYAP